MPATGLLNEAMQDLKATLTAVTGIRCVSDPTKIVPNCVFLDAPSFETIAGGSNAVMPTWHAQPAGNVELLKTDEILRIVGWLRTMYAGGGDKPWLNETPQK
jgi:hypothetical protein